MPVIQKDIYMQHYGVKGMRWGVRKKVSGAVSRMRKGDADTRARAKKIASKASHKYDKMLSAYRANSLQKRLGSQMAGQVFTALIKDFKKNGYDFKKVAAMYKNSPKKVVAAKVGLIAAKTIAETVIKDRMAKNVQKRYTAEGKRAGKRYKSGQLTPEQKFAYARIAARVATRLTVAGVKIHQEVKAQKASQGPFENFGQALLSDGNIIDLKFKE